MGLLDNTKNIELAITEKNKQDKQRQIEKRKKQQEKEDLQRLKIDVIREIKYFFDNAAEKGNDLKKYFLKNYYIEFTNNIIKNYGNNKTKIKNQIIDIIDNNYYKILKNKIQIQKKEFEILEQEQEEQEQEEAEQKQKEETKRNNVLKIFKIISYILLFIFFFPVVFIFLIILSLTKNTK